MLPIRHPVQSRRCLAIAILLALPALGQAATDAPECPVGVFKCPKKPISWEMCTRNDLLDFYVPGLPTSGDRNSVARDVSALRVTTPDKTHYVLEGDAEVRQLDLLVHAKKITYDAETTDFTAEGPVTYQDRGLLLSARSAKGNADLDRCTLDGARYQLLGVRGNGIAQVAVMDDIDHATLTNATYSTCDLATQEWAFSAREIELDRAEGIGRAHNVVFRVHNVPVFWLPYARFALDDRRVSGFLFPNFGYSDRRGFDFTVPYYLNLAPNYDATLLPRVMTDRGLMLGAEFRYLTEASNGTLNVQYLAHDNKVDDEELQYGQSLPASRWWYQWKDTSRFSDNWSASVNLNRVSDDRYFEDFGRGLYTSAISFLPSSAYLNGHGDWWTAAIGGDAYQITDPTLTNPSEPYRRIPRITFNGEHALAGPLDGAVDAEFVAFSKNDAVEGQRIDLYPHLTLPLETAAWFVRPELGYRYTAYDLDSLAANSNPLLTGKTPHRGVPIFSLDTGLVFERSLDIGGDAYTQTFEPRAYYLRVPYRNQDDLPLFDTQQIPFSFGELFRSNRFVGADRQMDANNLSLALTTRFLEDATGTQRLSASIGQIHYFDDQRVQLPGAAPTSYNGSIYAGELDLLLSDRWRFVAEQQWDPNAQRTQVSTFTVQNRFGSDGIFNFSYRYRRGVLEQIDTSAAIPISPSWRLIARENYALNNPQPSPTDPNGTRGGNLEAFVGVEHDTCCLAWRVIARRWVYNTQGQSDNALYFELEFKGIGSVGQTTDSFLRRGILGYQ